MAPKGSEILQNMVKILSQENERHPLKIKIQEECVKGKGLEKRLSRYVTTDVCKLYRIITL